MTIDVFREWWRGLRGSNDSTSFSDVQFTPATTIDNGLIESVNVADNVEAARRRSSPANILESTAIGGFTSVFVNHVDPSTGFHKGWETQELFKHNLLTNAGKDLFARQCYTNTISGTFGVIFIALAENSGVPASGDTVVSGELSGSMTRTSGDTITHTNGTNVSVIQKTFTCTDAAYSGIQKSGLFNNPTGITLSHQNTFTPTALSSGDQLQVQWTLTLG